MANNHLNRTKLCSLFTAFSLRPHAWYTVVSFTGFFVVPVSVCDLCMLVCDFIRGGNDGRVEVDMGSKKRKSALGSSQMS